MNLVVNQIMMGKSEGITKMQIAICDDETGTCSDIEEMILNFADSRALQIETEVFYSGEALYYSIQKQCFFDLIFLDIQLLQLDGVSVGKQIREQLGNEKISIVYISSKETYAMSLFQVRPLDFLIKPITKEKIVFILEKFIRLSKVNKKEFYFHIGKSIYRLYLDEIYYFACNGRKIEVYTDLGKKEFYGSMYEVWKQVEGKGFWTIHKSYIVNTAFVSIYHYDSIEMTNGITLPISQRYRKVIKENLIQKYQGE